MDLSKFSKAELIVAVGAIVLLVSALFLPWYGVSVSTVIGGGSATWSLWSASQGIAILVLIACVVAVGVIVLRALEVFDLSEQGVPESLVVLIAAAVAGLLVIFRVASLPGDLGAVGLFGAAAGVSAGRSWGLWIGLIGAVVFVVGAFMKFQEERA